jgi:hypothetical protein
MSETSETSGQKSLTNTHSATFSQALEAGLTHSNWLDGHQIVRSGQAPVRVSRSVSRERGEQLMIPGMYGRLSGGLSLSADLQSSLESRLRLNLDGRGSTEYALTWKHWAMESGLPIFALRASVLRTSGKGCGGWGTPKVSVGKYCYSRGDKTKKSLTLQGQAEALFAGWPTAAVRDHKGGYRGGRIRNGKLSTDSLDVTAQLVHQAGWLTPTSTLMTRTAEGIQKRIEYRASIGRSSYSPGNLSEQAYLQAGWPSPRAKEVMERWEDYVARHQRRTDAKSKGKTRPNSLSMAVGLTELFGGHVGTASPDELRLNPYFSLWLLGYPIVWGYCGARGIASARRSRKRSSGRSSKRKNK